MGARTHYFRRARAPIFLRARAPIFWKGTSTHHSKGHKHSLFEEQPNREQVSQCKMDMKEMNSWNALLKKWGRAPIIFEGSSTHLFEGSSTHFLVGHEHSLFKEQSNGERVSKCKMAALFLRARAPIFWGLEHSSFRRARALTIPWTLN